MKTKNAIMVKHSFWQSVRNALNGILWFFITERNGKIQLVVLAITSLLGIYFGINTTEWCFVALCGGLVIGLEIINTSIEQLCNDYNPGYKESIMFIKDASAGAVLFASIMSVIVGAIIFTPKIFQLLNY